MSNRTQLELLDRWAQLEIQRIGWTRLHQEVKRRAKRSGYAQLMYYLVKQTQAIEQEQQAIMNELMTRWDLAIYD